MCPTEDEIAALVAGKLSQAAVRQIHEHAETCTSCRRLLVQLAMTDEALPSTEDQAEAVTVPEQPPPGTIAAGGRLGRYHILQLLGAGGMGSVYAAYDPVLDR